MQARTYIHWSSACIRKHGLAHATRVLEIYERKFFTLILRFGTNPTLSRSCSKPLFSHYIKPYMAPFQNTQKILRENLRFTSNSESKREFFTKHPQVNFILIGKFSGLDLQVLKFTNHSYLIVNRFDWGERLKSNSKSFLFEVSSSKNFPSISSFC